MIKSIQNNTIVGFGNLLGIFLIFIIAQNISVLFFYSLSFLLVRILYQEKFVYMWTGLTISMLLNVFFVHMIAIDILLYEDCIIYSDTAHAMANNGSSLYQIITNDQPFYHWVQATLLVRLMAVLYVLSNNDMYIYAYVNFVFYFFSVVFFINAVKYLFDKKQNVYYLYLFLLFFTPSIYINSVLWKESLLLSLLLLLLGSLYKKKFITTMFVLIMIWVMRDVYIGALFVFSFALLGLYLFLKKELVLFFLLILIVLGLLTQSTFMKKVSVKVAAYSTQEHYKNMHKSQNLNSVGISSNMLEKENLISVKNVILPPFMTMYNNMAIRFFKTKQFDTFIENTFVSLAWLIGVPFVIIGLLSLPAYEKYTALMLILMVYFSSAYSLVSMSPEVFRYRLPMYGLFAFLFFYGMVNRKTENFTRDRYIKVSWYVSSFFIYMLYALTMVV